MNPSVTNPVCDSCAHCIRTICGRYCKLLSRPMEYVANPKCNQ